jgi:hypothetical protein
MSSIAGFGGGFADARRDPRPPDADLDFLEGDFGASPVGTSVPLRFESS